MVGTGIGFPHDIGRVNLCNHYNCGLAARCTYHNNWHVWGHFAAVRQEGESKGNILGTHLISEALRQ